MENAAIAIAVLACPVGMGLCMWLMARGMRSPKSDSAEQQSATLAELRSEQERLGAEIERLEHAQGSAVEQLAPR